jgi:hypothetical protein
VQRVPGRRPHRETLELRHVTSRNCRQGAAQSGGGQDRDAATSGGGEPARQRNWEETWWKRR